MQRSTAVGMRALSSRVPGRNFPIGNAASLKSGMEDDIRLLGFTKAISTLLAAADALVSPTRFEPYGQGVHEAICCGVPAFVTRCAALRSASPPKLHDLLLDDPPDAAQLCERLLEWHKDIDGYRPANAAVRRAVAPTHVDGHGGGIRRGDRKGRARGNPHRTEDRDLMARVGEDKAVPGVFVSRSARLAATIASGWVRTAVTVLIGLVSTPVLLRLLGPERFGAVRTAEQWFAYLEFLSFGLAAVVAVLLIRAATSGTAADVSGTAQTWDRSDTPAVSLGRARGPRHARFVSNLL